MIHELVYKHPSQTPQEWNQCEAIKILEEYCIVLRVWNCKVVTLGKLWGIRDRVFLLYSTYINLKHLELETWELRH